MADAGHTPFLMSQSFLYVTYLTALQFIDNILQLITIQ